MGWRQVDRHRASDIRDRRRVAHAGWCASATRTATSCSPISASGRWRTAWAGTRPAHLASATVIALAAIDRLCRPRRPTSSPASRTGSSAPTAGCRRSRAASGGDVTIGATIAALLAFDGYYACVWSGDSRIYLVRAGDIIAVVARPYGGAGARRERHADAARRRARGRGRNVVTRAIGVHDDAGARDRAWRAAGRATCS